MRMPFPQIRRNFAPAAGIPGLLLALLLTACAAPNPLMQEPAAANTKDAKPAPQTAQAAPAAAPSAPAPTPPAASAATVPAPVVQAAPPKPVTAPAPVAAAPAAPAAPAPSAAATPAQVPAAQTASAPTAAATPSAPAPAPAAPAPQAAAPVQLVPLASPSAPSGVQTTQGHRLFGILSPYRPDIPQGNFVSEEMVAQLRQGMTPDQVRFVLGTPLITDVFHANRWDYVFRLKKGDGTIISSRIVVFFQDNRLARVEGGNLPTEKDYLARLAGAAPEPAKSTTPAEAAKSAAPSAAAPK